MYVCCQEGSYRRIQEKKFTNFINEANSDGISQQNGSYYEEVGIGSLCRRRWLMGSLSPLGRNGSDGKYVEGCFMPTAQKTGLCDATGHVLTQSCAERLKLKKRAPARCESCLKGGHSYIGNSGAILRRSFTAAVSAVITCTYFSTISSSLLYFPTISSRYVLYTMLRYLDVNGKDK